MQGFDLEMVKQGKMGVDEVGDIEMRKGRAKRFSGFGIEGGRSRGAVASTEVIGADDEVAVGVDGLAGPDHVSPPAFVHFLGPVVAIGWRVRVFAREMLVSRESVEDQNGI